MKLDNSGNLKQLAVVGCGLVGRRHIAAIEQTEGVRVCAIIDPDSAIKRLASDKGYSYFADIDEMLSAMRPDGIIIATPTNLHVIQGIKCVEAGVPTLVEKPLSHSLEEGKKLVAASEKQNVPLLVGHHRRHNPIISKVKELISAGEIGEVRALHCTCWFYKPDSYFENAHWRTKKGAGPISVNLAHDIDLMRYLCGEVVQVQAQKTLARRGYENEDVASAVLGFTNGAIGTVTVSDSIVAPWSWEFTSQEYPIYPYADESSLLIGGSEGAISIPDVKIWKHQKERDWWTPIESQKAEIRKSDPLINQIGHFIKIIDEKEESIVSGREGLRTLAVVDAIQRSAESLQTLVVNHESHATNIEVSTDFENFTTIKPTTKERIIEDAV